MTDRITLLRCHDKFILAKRIEFIDNDWKREDYGRTASYAWEQRDVASIEEVYALLVEVAQNPRVCVIRGEPRAHVTPGSTVNRRSRAGTDGIRPDWEEARPGRQWVAFDIDKRSIPDMQCSLKDWGAAAAEVIRSRLPAPFRTARAVFKLSSSASLLGRDKVSLHLWFWLDRPVCDLSWRPWAKAQKIDSSLFSAVQPHYTADPVFVGVSDPLAGCRMGILPGDAVVTVPPELLDLETWEALVATEKAHRLAAKVKPQPKRTAHERYASKALQDAVSTILSVDEGDRHTTAFTQAISIGSLVGAGVLDRATAQAALTNAITSIVSEERHAKEAASVTEGIEIGVTRPRDMASVGTHAQKSGPNYPDLDATGKVLTTSPNLVALLATMQLRPWRNLMDHNTEWDRPPGGPPIPRECLQGVMESDVLDAAARSGWALSKNAFFGRLSAVEAQNAVHPVVEWVNTIPWDGVSRFDDLYATLIISPAYTQFADLLRIQLRKWLIAGGKCLIADPASASGVGVQGVLVLQGAQDLGKTRWFKALLPDSTWFEEGVTMDPGNKDSVIEATSSFIVELGELDATTRRADVAMLKSFLTRDVDEYRSPYGRKREAYPRRTLYGATVNPSEFLVDQTGNRRYWLMPCANIADPSHIDMQQLWAEACVLASTEGHWMPAEFKAAQQELAKCFAKRSAWADDFYKHFRRPALSEALPARTPVAAIRDVVASDRAWSHTDMVSFTTFLRAEGFDMAVTRGVMHARVVPVTEVTGSD